MKLAGIFPGFGSEYDEMFCRLSCYEGVGDIMQCLDDAAGIEVVKSLEKPLSAQLAIYGASVCYWNLLKDRYRFSVLAGHSLGLYGALYASGALSFMDGISMIVEAEKAITSLTGPEGEGWGMLAIIGLRVNECERLCAGIGDVFVSHVNSASQVLISGKARAVEQAGQEALEAGALSVKDMGIPYPLHTPYMDGICNDLKPVVNELNIREPHIPVFDHTSGRVMDADGVRDVLAGQISRRVLWRDTVIALNVQRYLEVGPSSILSKLVKWMHRDAEVSTAEESVCTSG